MNHYPHHIGDFNNATRHLTRVERSLYRDVLELYYDTEQPLNVDVAKIARRVLAVTESEQEALKMVLDEFFVLQDDGFHNARCDAEIAKYQGQIEQASRAGKASAAKRYGTTLTLVEQPLDSRCTNQNQNQNQLVAKATLSPAKLPTCPTQSVIDLFHEVLPELPTVRLLNDTRKKLISNFWKFVLTSKRSDGTARATDAESAMTWVRGYFERARGNDFLMGRGVKSGAHEGWVCDIDFLLSDKGRKQVIEKTRELAA
ncbi:MAG: YdaU family protein [Polaromonas sp.]